MSAHIGSVQLVESLIFVKQGNVPARGSLSVVGLKVRNFRKDNDYIYLYYKTTRIIQWVSNRLPHSIGVSRYMLYYIVSSSSQRKGGSSAFQSHSVPFQEGSHTFQMIELAPQDLADDGDQDAEVEGNCSVRVVNVV